mgnify:CR=1 FL=1
MDKEVQKALRHLAKTDPMMKKIIGKAGVIKMEPTDDYFACIVNNIICQLISTKAADTISGRLIDYTLGEIKPAILVDISLAQYRIFGIGKQKAGYIIGLAAAFIENADDFATLHLQSDKEVIKSLTQIRGIGKWTAEMFLIFGLARMDVFSPDDLALRNAMIKYFGMPADSKRSAFTKNAEVWAPYRSVASILLWRSLSVMD